MVTVKQILDRYFKGTKFDKKLSKKIRNWRLGWINKNEDHRRFFGGNLTGVYTIYFTLADIRSYMTDVYNLDIDAFKEEISEDPVLNKDWKISYDAFNIISVYVSYRYLVDDIYPAGAIESNMVFNYRTIAILHSNYYEYSLSEQEAVTVYTQLSGRYLLKKTGSWQGVMEQKSQDAVKKKSLMYTKLIKNNFDTMDYIKTVNDLQGRIRDMMKNIYRVMLDVKSKGAIIGSSTMFITDRDGDKVLMDVSILVNTMIDHISSVVGDKHNFIRDELIVIVSGLLPSVDKKLLLKTLTYLSEHSLESYIQDFITDYMTYTTSYLDENMINISDLSRIDEILVSVRGLWISSRSADVTINELRDIGDSITRMATNKKTRSTIAKIRTGMFLYIFLRAITFKHYLSK